VFQNGGATNLLRKHASTLSHLSALIETAGNSLELKTALDIAEAAITTEALAVSFVRQDGLRVLVDQTLLQQRQQLAHPTSNANIMTGDGGGERERTTECLEKVLSYPKAISSCICDEGGVELLLELLSETESANIVTKTLEVLSYVSNGEAAEDILESGGVVIVSRWLQPNPSSNSSNHNHGDGIVLDGVEGGNESNQDNHSDVVKHSDMHWATRVITNLSWHVRASHSGRTTYQTLALIAGQGGTPAWVNAIDSATNQTDYELQRRSLWALASWLAVEDRSAQTQVIRSNGLVVLLKLIQGENVASELARYARLVLSKLLCAIASNSIFRNQH